MILNIHVHRFNGPMQLNLG